MFLGIYVRSFIIIFVCIYVLQILKYEIEWS